LLQIAKNNKKGESFAYQRQFMCTQNYANPTFLHPVEQFSHQSAKQYP